MSRCLTGFVLFLFRRVFHVRYFGLGLTGYLGAFGTPGSSELGCSGMGRGRAGKKEQGWKIGG